MTVHVTPARGRGSRAAEITWTAHDDQHGYIAFSTESDQLASALTALGAAPGQTVTDNPDILALIARHTKELARILDRRAADLVVQLRDDHGMEWPQIAMRILGDPKKHSSVVRMYESGHRNRGA